MMSTNCVPKIELDNELLIGVIQQSEKQDFDYDALTSELQTFVQTQTTEIKKLMRRTAQDTVDIGQRLIEVKEQLGHGNFCTWLKAEFNWSVRTAARFIQVATQFKSANLTDLNIAVSALYVLAEPSTPKKACLQALELAKKGEHITHSKAKTLANLYQEKAQTNVLNPENTNTISKVKKVQEDVSLALFNQRELTQMGSEKLALGTEIQDSNYIRILNIENQSSVLDRDTTQTFDLTFAGIRVDLEGNPEILIILFEQMQNNPTFTKEILALINQSKYPAQIHLEEYLRE